MTAPVQTPFLTSAELPLYIRGNVLAQFTPGPRTIGVSTAGALGTRAVQWRRADDEDADLSDPVVSGSVGPWIWNLPDVFAALTFPAQSWTAGSYTVATDGTVTTNGDGSTAGLTAVRFDVVASALQSSTNLAAGWMKDAVVLPVTAWGEDVKRQCAALVHYELKTFLGMAPTNAAAGDEHVILRYDEAKKWFLAIGRGEDTSPDLVDSSNNNAGGTIVVDFDSATPVGWFY